MLGVTVNFVGIIIGTFLGLLFKKAIPEKVSNAVMTSLGLCVFMVGLVGLFQGKNQLVLIISMVIGTIIGEIINIDKAFNKFGEFVESKFSNKSSDNKIAKGFVSASLLFCIGSMAITGSLEAGISGNNTILFTKSLIDAVSACMFASTLGFGVALSSIPVFIYQGAIVLLSGLLTPVLEKSGSDIICCGSLMIVAIGLNMMNITKIKVANMLPALLIVPICVYVYALF